MSKKKFFMGDSTANEKFDSAVHNLRNKYYNLYRSQFQWTGLNYRQEDYIMKEFWAKGTVAAFKIMDGEIGFAPWAMQSWDMYALPETVILINQMGSPLVPNTTQIVDKDVVLGYIQSNKKPLKEIVDWYIDRIAQVEMVISTNLELHKMPFIIPIEEAKKAKARDLINRLLNNEIVIFMDEEDPQLFKAVQTEAPYIIDRLNDYKKTLEGELKTVLTINNPGEYKVEQLQLSEVNANNEEINDTQNDYVSHLQSFCERINKTLGITIGVKSTSELLGVEGEVHSREDKPGPKEGNGEGEE